MSGDRSPRRGLTADSAEADLPRWSPDGTRLLFQSVRGGNYDIAVINADGSGYRRLTTAPEYDGLARWSPDGKRIAFLSGDQRQDFLYIMDSDGGRKSRISDRRSEEHTSELQSQSNLVCRLLLEKKK